MSQFDFPNLSSPLSGADLVDNVLEPYRDAVNSNHSGTAQPSYVVPQMIWVDTSATPWVINMFDGAQSVAMGTLDPTTHIFTPSGPLTGANLGTNSVANTKLAQMATNTLKGNATAGTANAADIALAVNTFLGRSSSGNIAAKPITDAAYSLLDDTTTAAMLATLGALPLAGGTMTGKLTGMTSTTSAASMRTPPGVAPTSPVDGDIWQTSAGTFVRRAGTTYQIDSGASAQVVHVQSFLPASTSGSATTTGAWTKVSPNVTTLNEVAGASLASGVLTLPAGTYELDTFLYISSATTTGAYGSYRLRDTTNNVTLASQNHYLAYWTQAPGRFQRKVTFASTVTLELQYFSSNANVYIGPTGATSNGGEQSLISEIYARKVA